MTRINRRTEILETIAQLVRLSAKGEYEEGEYDHLVVQIEIGRGFAGIRSHILLKGVVRPLHLYREIDELNWELSKEMRRHTGRSTMVKYSLIVDKYDKVSAIFKNFCGSEQHAFETFNIKDDYLIRSHNAKGRLTSKRDEIWRFQLSKVLVWPLLPKNRLALRDFYWPWRFFFETLSSLADDTPLEENGILQHIAGAAGRSSAGCRACSGGTGRRPPV